MTVLGKTGEELSIGDKVKYNYNRTLPHTGTIIEISGPRAVIFVDKQWWADNKGVVRDSKKLNFVEHARLTKLNKEKKQWNH